MDEHILAGELGQARVEWIEAQRIRGEHLGEVRRLEPRKDWREKWTRLDAFKSVAWGLLTHPKATPREFEWALELAEFGLEKAPDDGKLFTRIGIAKYRLGMYSGAIEAFNQSAAHGNEHAANQFFLAMAFHQLGDSQRAKLHFDQAVEWMNNHDSRNPDLRRFRAEAALKLAEPPPTVVVPNAIGRQNLNDATQ